jgi:hypothetical protein
MYAPGSVRLWRSCLYVGSWWHLRLLTESMIVDTSTPGPDLKSTLNSISMIGIFGDMHIAYVASTFAHDFSKHFGWYLDGRHAR